MSGLVSEGGSEGWREREEEGVRKRRRIQILSKAVSQSICSE